MKGLPKGLVITTHPPDFDLCGLVARTLHIQDCAALDDDNLCLSPLTPLSSTNTDLDDVCMSPLTPLSSPALCPTSWGDMVILDIEIAESICLGPAAEAGLSLGASTSNNTWKDNPKKKRPDRTLPPHRWARCNAAASASRRKSRSKRQDGRPCIVEHHIVTADKIECDMKTEKLPIANGAHIALDGGSGNRKQYALKDLVGDRSKWRFQLQEWDGESSMALVDDQKRVIGILAGHPEDNDWPALHKSAAEALESRRSRCHVSKEEKKRPHRRGKFVALRCGASHGGGQRQPGRLQNHAKNEQVLNELNGLEPFKRLAGFASSVIATWCLRLYASYKDNSDALRDHYPELVPIFPNSVHSGFSYNLGPQTVCYTHQDFGNYAVGLCSITPFGTYDYKAGGHLVLWDLKLVVEFLPGSTILLPSAIIAHSNTSIQKHEKRYSFAQYTAGGLFRWVDNEFQTQEGYKASLSPEELVAYNEKQGGRLQYALSLLRTLS